MLGVVGGGCWVVFPLASCRRSTRDPPHEQLLVGLGRVVCRSLPYMVVVVIAMRWRCSTRDPPHEQLLVGLEVGGLSFVGLCWRWRLWVRRSSLFSSFHPRSTPRAVARGAEGGWSVVRWPMLALAFVGSSVFVVFVIPPAIHPTSSGSWGWGRVVCRSLSVSS
jgi:hypothetical protein